MSDSNGHDQSADALLVSTDTLRGDLRDAVLDRLRAMPKPWTVMSEQEQREMIEGVERVSRHLVTQAVQLIASNGHPHMQAVLERMVAKDGLQITLKASRHDPLRHDVFDALGGPAMIVLASSEQYLGERGPAKPDPDQPPLPEIDGDENVKPMRGRRERPSA